MADALSPLEAKLLSLSPSALALESAASSIHESPDAVRRAAEHLRAAGLLEVSREEMKSYEYTPDGSSAQMAGLPEIRLLKLLEAGPKPLAQLPADLSRIGVGLARRAGWITLEAGNVSLTPDGLAALAHAGNFSLPSSDQLSTLDQSRLPELVRRGLLRERVHSAEKLSITTAGEKAAAEFETAKIIAKAETPAPGANPSAAPLNASVDSVHADATRADAGVISQLDRNLLLSGGWKGRSLRRYDLSVPPETRRPARRHPIARVEGNIRRIFMNMGFEEMQGPLIESAFFNFDALFQPQDHPARDLADTFYLPGTSPRPPAGLAQKVKSAHEKGWSYQWDENVARQMVLRTHTTAVSARTLIEPAQEQDGASRPRKFFSIGKVFRNEATDYKHLAEFHQVEGIVVWEKATFGHLLGLLKSFYSQLGFDKIRFRPSYFPYTEPSLEIEVYHPARKAWLELGGAGIFRPEVCGPLGGKYPVLAWGLSLERPLMLANKIEDIRTLYRNDLSWLRDFPMQ